MAAVALPEAEKGNTIAVTSIMSCLEARKT